MVLYNPNIIFASATSNRQDLTPSQLEQGYVRQSQISSSEQNGSEYIKSLGLSQLYLIGNQYQSVIQYKYGMSCLIVYVASPSNVYIRRFVVKNEATWQTPITDTPPLQNASVTTEGDISFWSGGTVDTDNWQEVTQNVDNITITQRDGVLSVSGDYLSNIGELKLGLWDIGEQPFGFYPLKGDTYSLTSAVAQKIINYAPASIKRLFQITGTTITFPNLTQPLTDGNTFGFFPRFAQIAGQKQTDAIRNITGSFGGINNIYNEQGVFYYQPPPLLSISANTAGSGHTVAFDASRVVPTATENIPQTFTVIPYMYIGVEYEAPEPDAEGYIANKLITPYGYIEAYQGAESVGYLNQFFTVTGGTTYCLNPSRSGDPQIAPTAPLPQDILKKYGLGGEYDENYNFIKPITLQTIDTTPTFYYFTVSDTTKYIKLNMDGTQVNTLTIYTATQLFIEPIVQDGNRWMKINLPRDTTANYYVYKVNQIRFHDPSGYNILNINIGYYNLWQELLNRYAQATADQFTYFNVWCTDSDKSLCVVYQLGEDNIYTYSTTTPPLVTQKPTLQFTGSDSVVMDWYGTLSRGFTYSELTNYTFSNHLYQVSKCLVDIGTENNGNMSFTSLLNDITTLISSLEGQKINNFYSLILGYLGYSDAEAKCMRFRIQTLGNTQVSWRINYDKYEIL